MWAPHEPQRWLSPGMKMPKVMVRWSRLARQALWVLEALLLFGYSGQVECAVQAQRLSCVVVGILEVEVWRLEQRRPGWRSSYVGLQKVWQ